jgi:hypothetical protein
VTEVEDVRREALLELSEEKRLVFEKLDSGLTGLESSLPEACTPETQDAVGSVIARCKAVEKFAHEQFKEIVEPLRSKTNRQRALWKPLQERAVALKDRAQALVESLLAEERKRRQEAEEAARKAVSAKMAEQTKAEAEAMAAETPEAASEAKKKADEAWLATRQAVQQLDKAPAQTSVKVGDVTVYEASRLDFEIVNVGDFAKAHPELVEVRRGATLSALRAALSGSVELPETIPGFPGLTLKLKTTTSSRR